MLLLLFLKVNLEYIELNLEWSHDVSIYNLRNFILSKLLQYGDPLRWAITSVKSKSDAKIQIISVEAVMIINQDLGECINNN